MLGGRKMGVNHARKPQDWCEPWKGAAGLVKAMQGGGKMGVNHARGPSDGC